MTGGRPEATLSCSGLFIGIVWVSNSSGGSVMRTDTFYTKVMDSPVGQLQLVASGKGLCGVLFAKGKHNDVMFRTELVTSEDHPVLQKAEKQLNEYFAGKRTAFDLPLDMHGTIFQIKAWRELQKIPYGQTVSYGQQAKGMGDANKARAVGMANGRNPIAIIVPCHRVIGANGSLTGFGGGLNIKQQLLDMEQAVAAKAQKFAA